MWIRVAAKCGSAMRVETLAAAAVVDPMQWVDERVDALCAGGARGALYVFIRHPPDAALGAALCRVTSGRQLHPVVVATGAALTSGADLELLQSVGVRILYVTLAGATADTHDARTGEPGSWRRVLLLLTTAPRVVERLRIGAHLMLTRDTVDDLPGVLRLARKAGSSELLLWDGGREPIDAAPLEPAAALRALDYALRAAQKLELRIRAVGFERTRSAVMPFAGQPCVASGAVVDLLREEIPLPSARAGLLATDRESAAVVEAAPVGKAVAQLAFEMAGGGRPFLDLPACLGGVSPEDAVQSNGVKVDACKHCPIDPCCAGVPRPMMNIPGLREEIGPPRHWLPADEHPRVALVCPPAYDSVYSATSFSLARWLVRGGASVDVITPWATHADIAPAFSEAQRLGQPEGVSAVQAFFSSGPVDRYDLIVTPDPKVTHPLVADRRLPEHTRLAITDFHMLGGMDLWVRDLCPPGRRPEEGGWWPSEQIILYSGFPGYAPLYTRYGVPMRQVAWQPYALDPTRLPAAGAAADGTRIISGGNHRRDLDTLLAAAARLRPGIHPIDLYSSDQVPPLPPQIEFHGSVAPSIFCARVAESRFMIVPLREDPYNAAGVTAMVTAIACGRPLVVTASAAARDYVVDGVNGLLVPPGDPQTLADAIERLDSDDALLATLAEGARAAADQYTTEAWARALLHGTRTYEAQHWAWTKWRSRHGMLRL